ncbi:MAG TPA: hypothetical protein VIF44_06680 [Candidatus Limnocylindrales bacterium]
MGTTVAEDEAMTAATAAFTARDGAPATEEAGTAAEPAPWPTAAESGAVDGPTTSATQSASSAVAAARGSAARPPSRLLADLVRAMRSTAEESRSSLVESMRTEGTGSVERIHARSAEEVDGLRRVADEDIASIKDWSKAEIARIRAETEERIAERKQELELSLEGHAALIEREIEHVQARIVEYEAQMDAFFVRLEEIDDPSEFGSVAAEMPEPPSLEEASATARAAALDDLIRETTAARVEPAVEAVQAEVIEAVAVEPASPPTPAEELSTPQAVEAQAEVADAPVEAVQAPHAPDAVVEVVEAPQAPDAPQPAVEMADPVDEPAETTGAVSEPAETETTDPSTTTDEAQNDETDPRLTALGLTVDAEPEASESDAGASADPEIDAMSEATIAARLGDISSNGRTAPESTTSVVVIGLVSVASVAAFKRTLGKVTGVRSVGVSSGPEGEFVFKTAHDADVTLKDVIPTLPGFGARVVAAGDGVVNVSARDPESEA